MSISKGLAQLGRRKSAGAAALSLESADGWFPVGKRRELSPDAAMKISAVSSCVEIISNAEKIERYISQTGMSGRLKNRYGLDMSTAYDLAQQAHEKNNLPIEMISLAFSYGLAKGYRAAKAEAQK